MKKKIFTVLMLSSVVLSSLTLPAVVLADDFDNQIEQSNQKINQLNSQVVAAEGQLAVVQANIATIQADTTELKAQTTKLKKELTTLGEEVADLTERIEKRDETIKEQARSLQMDGKADSYVNAILSADSISTAITRVAAATKLVSASNDLLKEQESDKKEVVVKQDRTQAKVQTAFEKAKELEVKEGELSAQKIEQEILVNTIAAEKTSEEGKKAGFVAAKEAAEAKRAEEARQAAAKKAEEEAAAKQAAQLVEEATNNSNTNNVTPPVDNGNVVTPETPTPPVDNGSGNVTPPPANNGGGGATEQPTPPTPPVTPPSNVAGALIAEASNHFGKPYTQGAGRMGPNAFDCSGLTWYVYKQVTGKDIGSWTVPQESAGTQISVSEAQAGDLYFWGSRGNTYHVALATGGGGYIHAPTYGQTVTSASISAYFAPSFAVRVN